MNKLRLNLPILLLLITAFLTMQTTSVHVHLTDHHDHHKSIYEVENHTHDLTPPHFGDVELAHQGDSSTAIELDNSFNTSSVQKKVSDFAVILPYFELALQVETAKPYSSEPYKSLQNTSNFSPLNPRAPPYFS